MIRLSSSIHRPSPWRPFQPESKQKKSPTDDLADCSARSSRPFAGRYELTAKLGAAVALRRREAVGAVSANPA